VRPHDSPGRQLYDRIPGFDAVLTNSDHNRAVSSNAASNDAGIVNYAADLGNVAWL